MTAKNYINDELNRLWRIETLARRYRAAYLSQGGTDAEWDERLEMAQRLFFEALDR